MKKVYWLIITSTILSIILMGCGGAQPTVDSAELEAAKATAAAAEAAAGEAAALAAEAEAALAEAEAAAAEAADEGAEKLAEAEAAAEAAKAEAEAAKSEAEAAKAEAETAKVEVEAPAAEEVVVKVLAMQQAGYSPDNMDEIAARFSEQNPDVAVEVTYLAYDEIYDKLVTSMVAPEPAFDVFLVDDPWYTQFASAGWLLDVSDRVSPEYKDGIINAAWNVTTVDDKVYGMPWMIDSKMFYYNAELLEAANYNAPPATWEELEEMSLAMKEQGLVEYPIIWSWAQAEAGVVDFVLLVNGNGGEFFDADNNPVFNSEAGVEVLTWMVESINKGVTNPSSITSVEDDVLNVFSQGKAAFALNWPYMYSVTQFDEDSSLVTGKVGMAMIPVFDKIKPEGVDTVTTNGSMGFSIAANTTHPNETWSYLEFLTSKDIQMEYAEQLPPVWSSAYQSPELDTLLELSPVNEVLVPTFAAQYPSAVLRPRISYYTEASTILQLAMQEALIGSKTPQEALDGAAENIRDLQ